MSDNNSTNVNLNSEMKIFYTSPDYHAQVVAKLQSTIKQLEEANKQGANANAFLKAIIDSKDLQVIALKARCKELEIHAKCFEKIDGAFEGGEFHTADEMINCISVHIVNHDNKMFEFNKAKQD